MNAREVVRGYHDAWTTGDLPAARQWLADDLSFQGPIDTFTSAEPFMEALGGFQQMLQEAQVLDELYGGDRGMLLYDCVTETPAGTIRCAEHFKVLDDRIAEIKLLFDASELRKLIPPSS